MMADADARLGVLEVNSAAETVNRLLGDTAESTRAILAEASVPAQIRQSHRPGDAPNAFTQSFAGGDRAVLPAFPAANIFFRDRGFVARLTGSDVVVSRAMMAVEPGRTYQGRFVVQRQADGSSPSTDAVRLAVAWFNSTRAIVSSGVFEDLLTLTAGSGRIQKTYNLASAAAAGINLVAPAGAVYALPYVQGFGTTCQTDVEVCGLVDITDQAIAAPVDLTALTSRVSAQESINAGSRLTTVEAALSGPNSLRFETRGAAIAATIAASVTSLQLQGASTIGDAGTPLLYKKVASAGTNTFASADGGIWQLISGDFRSFDARDDNGTTDNSSAWAKAIAALPSGASIRVLKTSATGRYYFATTADFRALVIDADPGVTFYGPGIFPYIFTKTTGAALALENTSAVGFKEKAFQDPLDTVKHTFIDQSDYDFSIPALIDMSILPVEKLVWPSGTAWSASTAGVSLATNLAGFNFGTVTAANFHGIFAPYVAGSNYTASFYGAGNGMKAIFVRYETGCDLIYASDSTGLIVIAKRTYAAGVTTAALSNFSDAGTNANYFFSKGLIGIEMIAPDTYVMTVNGIEMIQPQRLSAPILDVGFGVYADGATTGSSYVAELVRTDNPQVPAMRPMRFLIAGDSNTDLNYYDTWVNDMRQMVQGSQGSQIEYIKSIAVVGETLAQQLTRMQAESKSGYTHCIFMLGTNDIQGQTSISAFIANLDTLIANVAGAFIYTTVVIPAQMYSRALANTSGGTGQNTANYDLGSRYRQIVRHRVAYARSLGNLVNIVEADRAIGATLSVYLNWDYPFNTVDPNMKDNIHLKKAAYRKLGYAIAKSALAFLSRKSPKEYPYTNFTPEWYQNGVVAGGIAPQFKIGLSGTKYIRGILTKTAAGIPDATQILQLPKYLWPQNQTRGNCLVGGNTVSQLLIQPSGQVLIYGVAAITNPSIILDNIIYD